jgi:succinate dehydrogenase membrane anchor subunit
MNAPKHIRTPLARVRGFGAAKTGTGDFWAQRLTAIAGVPLTIALVVIVFTVLGRNQPAAAQILGSAPIAIIILLFIAAMSVHMKIGMQVIIEDYVHDEQAKLALIVANIFFVVIVGLAAAYGVFRLSFGM